MITAADYQLYERIFRGCDLDDRRVNRYLPEQRLTIRTANFLRAVTRTGELSAVWTHVHNETWRSKDEDEQRIAFRSQLAKNMGQITGCPDFLFLWAAGSGAIELKAGKNTMSDPQTDFEDWCRKRGVRHALCRSLDEVKAALREWGVLHG